MKCKKTSVNSSTVCGTIASSSISPAGRYPPIATLVDQAETALFFHNVIGYGVPVVSGVIRTRERATMALGCENFGEIEQKLAQAIAKPIPPRHVNGSPTREVTLTATTSICSGCRSRCRRSTTAAR